MLTKVHLVKAMAFPVVMYGCESWTIKKAESQRIDASEQWCWRRLLRVPWTARRSNQPILKEISPECSLEGLMLKVKLQCFGHPMRRTDSLEKTLMLGKIEGRRRGDDRGWDGWMASLTRWTWWLRFICKRRRWIFEQRSRGDRGSQAPGQCRQRVKWGCSKARTASNHYKLGRGEKGFSCGAFRGGTFKPPNLCYFVMIA